MCKPIPSFSSNIPFKRMKVSVLESRIFIELIRKMSVPLVIYNNSNSTSSLCQTEPPLYLHPIENVLPVSLCIGMKTLNANRISMEMFLQL